MRSIGGRAVTKALIWGGGGGGYSYIRVQPDEFLLKSVFILQLISKEIRRGEREYMNICTPLPQLTLGYGPDCWGWQGSGIIKQEV